MSFLPFIPNGLFSGASVSAKTALRMGILHPTSDAPFTQLIIAIVRMERKQIDSRSQKTNRLSSKFSPSNRQGPTHRAARVPDLATLSVIQDDTSALLPGWSANGKDARRIAPAIDKHKALCRHDVRNRRKFRPLTRRKARGARSVSAWPTPL
jgi:hypothetical protein